jgi:hypothetical protein
MCGAILPLPQYVFMAWCSVKHRDNFNFTFTFTFNFEWFGHVKRMRAMRSSYKILYGNFKQVISSKTRRGS